MLQVNRATDHSTAYSEKREVGWWGNLSPVKAGGGTGAEKPGEEKTILHGNIFFMPLLFYDNLSDIYSVLCSYINWLY